ncbi:RipA family octameric membrane protein [Salininema proteolyticum]|uniref:Small integral membrane protein n=1 Tax=Salininema proteolyticum TaxID=1607685 RepID=A0ABV8TZV2_9ACTN
MASTESETTVGEQLWNEDLSPDGERVYSAEYRSLVLEQYKLCVEMADRVSSRRNTSNTFFLSLNTALFAALAALAGDKADQAPFWLLACAAVLLVTQCAAWFLIVRSYRLLNAGKFKVIAAMEERLPAFAYSRAEWSALGEGRDWRLYLPLSRVEQWVPVTFALAYVLGFFAAVT